MVIKKKIALAYTRVSTRQQAEDGVSLKTQTERIESYCDYKGFVLEDIIEDSGISGSKNRTRSGFVDLLDQIQSNEYNALVLFDLSRLSRDMLTLLALERLLDEQEMELHTIEGQIDTSTPDGFMNFAMKSFLGEMERRQVKYRTRKAMQFKKSQGNVVGSIPFGYRRDDDMLVLNPEEQRIVKLVNKWYSADLHLAQIVDRLRKKGLNSRSGKPFTSQQVKRMITGYENKWRKGNGKIKKNIRRFVMAIG